MKKITITTNAPESIPDNKTILIYELRLAKLIRTLAERLRCWHT